MKLSKSVRLLSLGAMVLLLGGAGIASATEASGWEITGTNAAGQRVIVSTGTQVGQLDAHTYPATTSASTGNYVTLFANTLASANSGATIEFDGPNNVFINNGTIQGPFEDDSFRSPFANTGMGFYASSGSLFNQQVYNNGNIYGGNGNFEGCGVKIADTGLAFLSNAGIYNILIDNTGGIFGGGNLCYSGSSPLDGLGDGILLYDANEVVDISGVSITNSGIISGGSNVMNANVVGTAVTLLSAGSISDISIGNAATGSITGGNDVTRGFVNGSGVVVLAGFEGNSSATINGLTLNNAGLIAGGNDDSNSNLRTGPMIGNIAGTGVALEAANGVYNVGIINSGIISGGSFARGGEGECYFGASAGSGLAIFDSNKGVEAGDINGVGLINSGGITGGMCSSEAYIVGSGVGIVGEGNVLNIGVINTSTGYILGGNSNSGDDEGAVIGSGLGIVAGAGEERSSESVTSVVIRNAGTIAGGNNNNDGIVVGSGIGIAASDGVYAVNIANFGGQILGGNNNEEGNILGSGIGIYDNNDEGKDINGVLVVNTGLIAGGTNNRYAERGMAGVGIGILGEGNVSDVIIDNAGSVAGGSNNLGRNDNDFGGEGILVASEDGKVDGVTINNLGNITGGLGIGNQEGGNGIEIDGESITHTTINNLGYIAGGNGGNGMVGCINDYGQDGGDGILVSADFCDPDLAITNGLGGTILGGNGGNGTTSGGNGGAGVYVDMEMGTNINITNFGTIRGGNAGAGGTAGEGIQTFGSNITINNWGTVAAGTGAVQGGVPAGFPAVAISVSGSNNVINLNGHSAVYGTLQGVNGPNNVLNLNFTGLSPQAIATIKSELAAQGYPGNDFHGTFTVRGVTYYVDPLLININLSSYGGQGLTFNQIQVGNNIDSLTTNPTGSFLAMVNAIDASGDVPLALEALSPQPYQIYGDIAEATSNFMTLSIDERLNNLRDGSESIDTTGIGGTTDHTTTAGYDKDGKNVVVPDVKSLQKQWGFFAQGSGLFTSIDAHGGDLSNAGFTTSGLILGLDGKLNDRWVLGTLFNYDYTVANLDQVGSKANVQTLGGGVYAGYHNEGWYGNGLAAWGSNDYDSNRNIFIPGFNNSALAETHGNQESVNIDGGYDFHMLNNKLTVGPLAGLQYVHLDVNGFNEGGANAADLSVGSQDVDSLRSRFGFRMDYHTQIAKEVAFATEIRAAWQHEFMDDSRTISGAFIGSGLGAFGVVTTKPQRDAALVGVGANFTVRDRMTLFFDYDVQAGQQSYLEQSVKGGIKLSF